MSPKTATEAFLRAREQALLEVVAKRVPPWWLWTWWLRAAILNEQLARMMARGLL